MPDSYTISIEKQGFESLSQAGINVFADQAQTLTLSTHRGQIGRVTSRSSADVVRPGTTSDVYSVNAARADKSSALGGGGSLNQVYSAVATVPGVYVPTGSNGWFQTIQIRGGSFNEVGYELDGVPVNRSFDFYPAHTASWLGQSEVQVYTGSAPANSESQGLSGFINQVIRTGTYPSFTNLDLGLGSPAFYHHATVEIGGATSNRPFSYYVGISGTNQDVRALDQFNGRSFDSIYGTPFAALPCGSDRNAAGCYNGGNLLTNALGSAVGANGFGLLPYDFTSVAQIADRENVVNLHCGRSSIRIFRSSDLTTRTRRAEITRRSPLSCPHGSSSEPQQPMTRCTGMRAGLPSRPRGGDTLRAGPNRSGCKTSCCTLTPSGRR